MGRVGELGDECVVGAEAIRVEPSVVRHVANAPLDVNDRTGLVGGLDLAPAVLRLVPVGLQGVIDLHATRTDVAYAVHSRQRRRSEVLCRFNVLFDCSLLRVHALFEDREGETRGGAPSPRLSEGSVARVGAACRANARHGL